MGEPLRTNPHQPTSHKADYVITIERTSARAARAGAVRAKFGKFGLLGEIASKKAFLFAPLSTTVHTHTLASYQPNTGFIPPVFANFFFGRK